MSACLDSWAVLAWLDGEEPAAARVQQVMPERPAMSWINACEVHYRVARDHGDAEADFVLGRLRRRLRLELPAPSAWFEAARLKARHPIALADCFAIATAAAHDATLLTGDPKIVRARDLPCRVDDLRARRRR